MPIINKDESRLEIIEKIKIYEKNKMFDVDVENDPPTIPLQRNKVDYLKKKLSSKIKTKIANKIAKKYINNLIKNNKLIIKNIYGIENMTNLNSGAIITCNHFNAFDNFAIQKCFEISGQEKKRKLFKVIREGNYTSFPGLYGMFFKNCNTLPLSSIRETMRDFLSAINIILKRGDFVLIYPEQAMWWNYKKIRPFKDGAFRFACEANVPVLPIFMTMEDSNIIGDDGFYVQEYSIHIMQPIYQDKTKSFKQNVELMKNLNYDLCKQKYEEFYKIPLSYETKEN